MARRGEERRARSEPALARGLGARSGGPARWLYSQLRALASDVRQDEPMSRHVYLRIGGPADLLVIPRSLAQLQAVVELLFAEEIRFAVIGQGSNVLVGDRGVRGVVVKIGKGCDRVRFEGARMIAGAGAGLPSIAQEAARLGLAGLEFAAGIPGSVAGAVVMNAGAHGGSMSDVVESVTVLTPQGPRCLRPADLAFGYRSSVLQARPWVVASVDLALRPDDPAAVRARLEGNLALRSARQPIGVASCGCMFRNPPCDHAGRLIEAAGCKGMSVGRARVSKVHANFIINEGGATASDVLTLAEKIRNLSRERFGVPLDLEVKLLGEF